MLKEQIINSMPSEEVKVADVISLEMPARFKLLGGLRPFRLQELPSDFQTLVQTYYKRKCRNCKKQPKESAICLLCGDIVCFMQKCCSNGVLKGMKSQEGELSFHTRTCEGGNAIFLCTTNGKIILVDEERSSQRPSPYVNKFGETFSASSKRWDNYHLQTGQPGSGGGASANLYDSIKKLYMNFGLSNEVIKDRSMTDVVWRLRAI